MNVWVHDKHGNKDRITFDDTTNTYRFYMDDHKKVEISDALVKVFDPLHDEIEIFSVNESGGVHIQRNMFEISQPGTDDYILRVGRGVPGDVRGRVEIHQQPQYRHEGEEFYMPKKAGILVLYNENGDPYFLWVDSNGKLRISSSDPRTSDLSGEIVGPQS